LNEALVIRDINTLPTELADVVPSFKPMMLKQHNLHHQDAESTKYEKYGCG
jgi:hypothetical protein